MKTCSMCREVKPLSEFPPISANSTSYKKIGTNHGSHDGRCYSCKAAYAREWRKRHPGYRGSGKLASIPKEDRLLMSAIQDRLNQAKARIKKFGGVETDLDREYLYQLFKDQQGKCALSGVALKIEKGAITCLSLDKIDPNLGYVKGNVQWVAWAVNRAKGDMTLDVFIDMCRQVIEHQKVQRLSKGSAN